MAIQNRDAPAAVAASEFDPAKISPGDIVILEEAGRKHAFVGLSAGEPVRLASYDELESASHNARLDREAAEDAQADAVVRLKEIEKLRRESEEAVAKAARAVEAAERAEQAAQAAESALAAVNTAIAGLGNSLASSLSSVVTAAKGGG